MYEKNREAIRRNFEIISAGASDRAMEVVTADYVSHESERQPAECRVPGPAGYGAAIRWLHEVFSDVKFAEEWLVCEGDRAVCQCTMSARHTGQLLNLPPTGRQVSVRQTHLFRMSGARIAEHWMTQDDLSMLNQLGALAESQPARVETPATVQRRGARSDDRKPSSRDLGKVGSELLFVNDRVKVWEMRLEPGETCAAHRHHNDYLMLYPNPAIGRSTSRSTIEHVEAGFVAFATVGTQGLPPHQITNLGDEPVTHYIIELLGPSAAATTQPPQHNGRIRFDSRGSARA